MNELKLNGAYDVVLGESSPQKGVYLGKLRGLRRILVRTRDRERRDSIGTPRIYNFNCYLLSEDELSIEYPVLSRAIPHREIDLAEKILKSRGI